MSNLLIIDSDEDTRLRHAEILRRNDYCVTEASNGEEALGHAREDHFAAVLLSMNLPGVNWIDVLQQIKETDPSVQVIMSGDRSDIKNIVESMKLGAYDYFIKDSEIGLLVPTVKRAVERFKMEGAIHKKTAFINHFLERKFGKSNAIRYVIDQITPVANSNLNIIIQGEAGSGKNYLARTLHYMSKRAKMPIVPVDLGSVPDSKIETELYGYEKGWTSGAENGRKGLLDLARGGTLVISGLQDMTPFAQDILFRILNEKKFSPIGDQTPSTVDVRFIACAKTDIRRAVHEKKFREDLLFLLGEYIFFLPPLCERREDIQCLTASFLEKASEDLNKQPLEISEDAMNILLRYNWPGNIRELRDTLAHAVLISSDGIIRPSDIVLNRNKRTKVYTAQPAVSLKDMTTMAVRDTEVHAIKQALSQTKGNKTLAAKILKIDYKTLLTKIKDYNLTE
jgi:two-component system nitrogen regulation response regulator GlnG